MSNETYEQLMALRVLVPGGILHPAQIKHLQYWPRVVFQHSTASEFAFDAEKKVITFKLQVEGDAPDDIADRLAFFDLIVKRLLGEDIRVKVVVGKKIVLNRRGKVKHGRR